jgi:hypothetical protein
MLLCYVAANDVSRIAPKARRDTRGGFCLIIHPKIEHRATRIARITALPSHLEYRT